MLALDPVRITEVSPRLTLGLKRMRAAMTGRNYFFNGQKQRARVFDEIDAQIHFANYVETGTFLGMTTDFLARRARARGAQVYSCEINDRHHGIATRTVGHLANVDLHKANSVDFLRGLAPEISKSLNFVYLDAHWNDYLPLRDELSILRAWDNTIVLIDDFKVPLDPLFRWDKYDEEREICLEHIAGAYGNNPVYFPSYPAHEEMAPPRGYCLIAFSPPLQEVLERSPLLARYRP